MSVDRECLYSYKTLSYGFQLTLEVFYGFVLVIFCLAKISFAFVFATLHTCGCHREKRREMFSIFNSKYELVDGSCKAYVHNKILVWISIMTYTRILHHPATQAARDFSLEANLSIFPLLENSELKFNIQAKVVKGKFFCEVFSFLSKRYCVGWIWMGSWNQSKVQPFNRKSFFY